MALADDLRQCMRDVAQLGLSLPLEATLESGLTVACTPGVASSEDALTGKASVAGKDFVLRVASADVPGIKSGQALVWNQKTWIANHIELTALGEQTRVFLGSSGRPR